MSIKLVLSTLILSAVIVPSLAAIAQTQGNATTLNMETLTCKELMLSNSENRALIMSFFHGFFSGKNNETAIDATQLAKMTDEIKNDCADAPQKTLMSVFEEYRGSNR